jgi:GTPase involved in cell partitioning and DNA repair
MSTGEIVSFISLAIAVIFWILSTKQANDAKKTLGDIKSEIITWQTELNKAAINIISSRPEVIAKESAAEESKAMNEFSAHLTELIEKASINEAISSEGKEHQLKVLGQLLDHHKNLILGKQQLMNQAIAMQMGQQPIHSKPSAQDEDLEQNQ